MVDGRDLILKALNNLKEDEFRKFKLKLQTWPLREGFSHISRGTLHSLDPLDLADKIVCFYLEHYGMALTAEILGDIGMQEEAVRLQQAAGAAGRTHPVGNKSQPTQHPAIASTPSGMHFVDRHRASLISRVTLLDPVLDNLFGNILKEEQYQAIRAEHTHQEKMRRLYDYMPAWDNTCKDRFLEVLTEYNPHLVRDLEGH